MESSYTNYFQVNPILQRTQHCRHHKAFLAKQTGQSRGKMSLVSAPGSVIIKSNAYEVTSKGIVVLPRPCALVKTSMDNSSWQTESCSDDQAYTLLVLQIIPPGAKRPRAWLVLFFGKYASTRAVDLIQREKNGFPEFYESNLTEAILLV